MGSTLSGTLANLYLNYIENSYIINNSNRLAKYIVYWHRYVDDIILLFNGTARQLSQLHNHINNIHNNIDFTIEVEQEHSINFLDLTIQNNNHQHSFKIYRKKTQTDHTIHAKSNHPYQHKIAAYNHMVQRMNNIPMHYRDYADELNNIKYIASNNGFNPNIIDSINEAHINKRKYYDNSTLSTGDDSSGKYICVEYNKNTSKHLQKAFSEQGYKIAYKTTNKIERKVKTKSNTTMETGVYKLKCSNCPAFYIGQTGRSFKQRFCEHTRDVNKPNTESRYALHLNKMAHKYDNIDSNMEIMHRINKGNLLNRMEEFEIYKEKENIHLLNNKVNTETNKIYDLIMEYTTTNLNTTT